MDGAAMPASVAGILIARTWGGRRCLFRSFTFFRNGEAALRALVVLVQQTLTGAAHAVSGMGEAILQRGVCGPRCAATEPAVDGTLRRTPNSWGTVSELCITPNMYGKYHFYCLFIC
jgi:hypothetical protein